MSMYMVTALLGVHGLFADTGDAFAERSGRVARQWFSLPVVALADEPGARWQDGDDTDGEAGDESSRDVDRAGRDRGRDDRDAVDRRRADERDRGGRPREDGPEPRRQRQRRGFDGRQGGTPSLPPRWAGPRPDRPGRGPEADTPRGPDARRGGEFRDRRAGRPGARAAEIQRFGRPRGGPAAEARGGRFAGRGAQWPQVRPGRPGGARPPAAWFAGGPRRWPGPNAADRFARRPGPPAFATGRAPTPAALFERIDRDADNSISRREFVRFYHELAEQLFGRRDAAAPHPAPRDMRRPRP